jgi:hypothetical protein
MYARYGGCLDLNLIEAVTASVLKACNETWISRIIPQMAKDTGLPDPLDLTTENVQGLIQWAEEKAMVPGVVHGDRRRAMGVNLIRTGVELLRGRIRTPNEAESYLKILTC